jgi:hypothetical protein
MSQALERLSFIHKFAGIPVLLEDLTLMTVLAYSISGRLLKSFLGC